MKRFLFLCMSLCVMLSHLVAIEVPVKDIAASLQAFRNRSPYLVIDLSKGVGAASYPLTTLFDVPDGGWTEEYKTDKLVLRYIEAGSFMMGSPADELGRGRDEDYHHVTLTKPYYIGVFEVTQSQWTHIMGRNPSWYKGEARPVEKVSYEMIRGSSKGIQLSTKADVDRTSFMGRLRAKTTLDFDLPTEAQWEYACRAGTTTAFHSGENLTDDESCSHLTRVGRYKHNQSEGRGGYAANHTAVGSYLPNAWGLYDMHGNVSEWCLDGCRPNLGTAPVVDPLGMTSNEMRLLRGGSWYYRAQGARSADRYGHVLSEERNTIGLRVAIRSGTTVPLPVPLEVKRGNHEVADLVTEALSNPQSKTTVNLGKVTQSTARDIKKATGVDVTDYEHTMFSDDIRHANNRHGVPRKGWNGKRLGEQDPMSIPLTKEDLQRIPEIYTSYDFITRGTGLLSIRYHKDMGDGTMVVCEVLTKKKKLQFKTAWKSKNK